MSGFEEGVVFTFGFGGRGGGGAGPAPQPAPPPPPPPPTGSGPGGALAWEVFPDTGASGSGVELIPVDVAGRLLPGPPLRRAVVPTATAAAALAAEGRGGGAAAPPPLLTASDLVPRVYEGGFKAWEGGEALARLLAGDGRPGAPVWAVTGDLAAAAKAAVSPPTAMSNASVLELGAGAALPSLVAARRGAASLDVADYNPSVLAHVTAVNVREAGATCPVRFWAGDWAGLPAVLAGRTFSLVLAAEVGYAPDSLPGFVACLTGVLGGSESMAFIALKRHYFGVGGGSAALVAALSQAGGGSLDAGVVASTEERGTGTGVVPVDVVAVRRRPASL